MAKTATSTMTENLTLNAGQVLKAIVAQVSSRLPLFLWGPPGIGKSDLVREAAQKLDGVVIDLRMSQLDPTDIRGIPFYNKELNKMDWAPPIMLPDEEFAKKHKVVILFLDEINSAAPAVQASAYQLVLDRRVGNYVLPENVALIAAGNRENDKGVTFRLPAPLANRFDHVEMRADFESWQLWAVMNTIHPDIVGFLTRWPQYLYNFDPKISGRSFATPRSWARVSRILNNTGSDEDTKFNLIAGAVGEGVAGEFSQYRKNASILPDPMDILTGKIKTLSEKADLSVKYSLVTNLCYTLKQIVDNKKITDKRNKEFNALADNFFTFMMENFAEQELVVMGGRLALRTYNLPLDATMIKNYEEFSRKYAKLILAAYRQ